MEKKQREGDIFFKFIYIDIFSWKMFLVVLTLSTNIGGGNKLGKKNDHWKEKWWEVKGFFSEIIKVKKVGNF